MPPRRRFSLMARPRKTDWPPTAPPLRASLSRLPSRGRACRAARKPQEGSPWRDCPHPRHLAVPKFLNALSIEGMEYMKLAGMLKPRTWCNAATLASPVILAPHLREPRPTGAGMVTAVSHLASASTPMHSGEPFPQACRIAVRPCVSRASRSATTRPRTARTAAASPEKRVLEARCVGMF